MKETIEGLLSELDIPYRWVEHPAVFTVAESMKHIEDKRPIKNILLQEKGEGQKILVILAGEKQVDARAIAAEFGTRKLRFAGPEVLEQTLGVKPGSVSIFGLLHPGAADVKVVIDKDLLAEPELGFHPNDNTATIFIPGSAVEHILRRTKHLYRALDIG
jgi:Ala-tRNA(Pro) deacylase